MKQEIQSDVLEKAKEAATQYKRAELFWNCSNMSDEQIEYRKQRFLIGYEEALKALTDALFPQNAKDDEKKEAETYLKEKGLDQVVILYQERKKKEEDEKVMSHDSPEYTKRKEEKEAQESLMDPSITEAQREGLQKFHQWLYRNCDRKGIKYFGEKLFGSDGSARTFVDKFMSQPASVQLKALYLLEKNKRKEKDTNGQFSRESQENYVPDLDKLKNQITASKFKFWKRTTGSYLYWNKLNEALEAAETDRESLLEFRKTANELAEKNPQTYRSQSEFQQALQKLNTSNMEAGEKTGTFDKVSEVTDMLSSMNDVVDQIQSVAINTENGIKQGLNGFKTLKEALPNYTTRLVEKMGGETASANYSNASNIGFSAFSTVSGIISIISGSKELVEARKVQNTMGKISGTIGIGSSGASVTGCVNDVVGGIGECFNASEEFAKKIGRAGNYIFGAANLLVAAKGGVDLISGGIGKSHANKAGKLAEKLNDIKMQNRARFAKFLNQKKQNQGIRGFFQGAMGATSAAMSLFATSVPIVGQVAAIGSVSLSLYESYIQQNKDLRAKYRKGIDTELFRGGEDLKAMDVEYKQKLKNRMANLDRKSDVYKKLDNLCKDENKEKRYDILRKEMAVKQNSVFLRDCYEKTVVGLGDEAYRNVFYIDPSKGGKFENLITKENYDQYFKEKVIEDNDTDAEKKAKEAHNEQVKVRMSYKELMESFGTRVKFSSSEDLKQDLQKKYKDQYDEQKMHEKMEKKLEEKREKTSNAFTKL